MKRILITLIVLAASFTSQAQTQLYRVNLLRAKPGELLNLISVIKTDMTQHQKLGIEKPYLLRHSQGDHWDLMLIYPIQALDSYFSAVETNKRTASQSIEKKYGDAFFDLVSFQEEAIVSGPDLQTFINAFDNYNLFHIEIFTALAGKQSELLKQREMENVFYSHINHRPNLIFTRVFGPAWDNFTIGSYQNLQEYAADGGISFEQEDAAAKKAGFEGVNFIGSYLRSLLLEHHDTLANKVK
ncbi:MAG: hypothetical protein RQ735_10170 [Flavobacteriaceae bacterium]|nr:hypothetical protein [Flavobacteriaceae bacterium]